MIRPDSSGEARRTDTAMTLRAQYFLKNIEIIKMICYVRTEDCGFYRRLVFPDIIPMIHRIWLYSMVDGIYNK